MNTYNITYNIKQIDTIAKQILHHINTNIIVFNGEIGAGKTTLIKALLKAMGSKDNITSPTFSLVNTYEIPNNLVYHFDLYRITSITEVLDIGFEDYLHTNAWVFIEWPDHVLNFLPKHYNCISITLDKTSKERTLSIS